MAAVGRVRTQVKPMCSENGQFAADTAAEQQLLQLVHQLQADLLGLPGELNDAEKIRRIADRLIKQHGIDRALAIATLLDDQMSSEVSAGVLAELTGRSQ